MAYALQREKLARAARALNAEGGWRNLPALILMTDQARLPDPAAAARSLPRGSAVILRHTDMRTRATLGRALVEIARERGLLLLVAGDSRLAADIGAHGLHLPEARAREAAYWRALRPSWLITASAHSARGLAVARSAGADAALLAPVFATSSHPDREPLGVVRVRLMAARAGLPVYALGGINAQTIARLRCAKLAGIAAIEGLLPYSV
jgi:thiamine-phosphate pyrophosphorylase